DGEELEALGTISSYIAIAVQNHILSEALQQRVVENLKLLDSMHGFCDQAMEVFASAIDAKEFRSSGHSLRVGRYAAALAGAMEMDANEVAELRAAGYLHDIGKVTVDKRLFLKPAALEANEFREMADHTLVGHRIISGVQFPWPRIGDVVRWHHERCDGSGYPDRLHKEQLSLPVRIVAVADSFDAMTHERPYRASMSVGQALSEIVRQAPQKYDSEVVQALLACVRGEATGRGQQFLDSQAICTMDPAKRALHALNRLTFGPRPGEVERVSKMGVENWIELQLNPDKINDPNLDARLAPFRTLRMSTREIVENFPPPQAIRAIAEGRQSLPSDPARRAIYQSAIAMYEEKKERKAEKTGDAPPDNGSSDPVNNQSAQQREERMYAELKSGEILDLPPE